MFSRLKLQQQALILTGLLLVFQLIFVGCITTIVYRMYQELGIDFRLRQISVVAFQLIRISSETAPQINYEPGAPARSIDEKVKHQAATERLKSHIGVLSQYCRAYPEMEPFVARLSASADDFINVFGDMAYNLQKGQSNWNSFNGIADDRMALICEDVFEALGGLQAAAEQRETQTQNEVHRLQKLMTIVLWSGVPFSLVLAVISGALYAQGVRRPLEHARDNCRLMAERKELLPPLAGENEISEADRSIHAVAVDVRIALERDEVLIENAVDVICSISAEGLVLTANKSIERLLGVAPQIVRNKKIFDYVPESHHENLRRFLETTAGDEQIRSLEVPVTGKQGAAIETSWTGFWSEEHKTVFCVMHDISRLKEADRQQREFLELVTLDLRRPLLSVSAALGTILRSGSEESDAVVEEIESARLNLERLLAFADDLVDFQRLEIGEMKMQLEQADLVQVVRQSADLLQQLLVEKDVSISFAPSMEAPVYCDAVKITKVVTNFLSNAIKWSPAQGKIGIEINKVYDKDFLEVSVSDDGPGIADEYAESVFEAFEQLPGSEKKKGGTGLGLAICRKIVEAHGGTIGVRKRGGARFAPQESGRPGSVFWFTLPLETANLGSWT